MTLPRSYYSMKIAVSIPNPIFFIAENIAKKLGISRSKLFSLAIEEFIQNHTWDDVTEKLNNIYSNQDDKLDDLIYDLQSLSIAKEDW